MCAFQRHGFINNPRFTITIINIPSFATFFAKRKVIIFTIQIHHKCGVAINARGKLKVIKYSYHND